MINYINKHVQALTYIWSPIPSSSLLFVRAFAVSKRSGTRHILLSLLHFHSSKFTLQAHVIVVTPCNLDIRNSLLDFNLLKLLGSR